MLSSKTASCFNVLDNCYYFHVFHGSICIVACTTLNVNSALVFEFLMQIVKLGVAYFKVFDEKSVQNNFVLIYELLDEICDFGYPQITQADTLMQYITSEAIRSDITAQGIAMQATGAVSWRRPDIKYRTNECFVDVLEKINLLVSTKGTVLKCSVTGQVMFRCFLSGMPECKFGLNDKIAYQKSTKILANTANTVELESCQFHQCVKLNEFEKDRIINFIPPDGEFELLKYAINHNVDIPIKVHAVVNELANSVEYTIAVKSYFSSKIQATSVVVKIPVPSSTSDTKIHVSDGKAKYKGEINSIVWK